MLYMLYIIGIYVRRTPATNSTKEKVQVKRGGTKALRGCGVAERDGIVSASGGDGGDGNVGGVLSRCAVRGHRCVQLPASNQRDR